MGQFMCVCGGTHGDGDKDDALDARALEKFDEHVYYVQ